VRTTFSVLIGLPSAQTAPASRRVRDGRAFHASLAKLRQLGHSERCAIMCAETLWWRCHRRNISDYLIAAGEAVFHILGPDHVARAFITTVPNLAPIECSPIRLRLDIEGVWVFDPGRFVLGRVDRFDEDECTCERRRGQYEC
jgi:hypothetical protein